MQLMPMDIVQLTKDTKSMIRLFNRIDLYAETSSEDAIQSQLWQTKHVRNVLQKLVRIKSFAITLGALMRLKKPVINIVESIVETSITILSLRRILNSAILKEDVSMSVIQDSFHASPVFPTSSI
jgi:hypothetical protein